MGIREKLPGELGSRRVTQLQIGACVTAGMWVGQANGPRHDERIESTDGPTSGGAERLQCWTMRADRDADVRPYEP